MNDYRKKERMLMKKTGIVALVLMTVLNAYAGLTSKPVSMRIGAKSGLTICTYDDNIDDTIGNFTGAGIHIGFGMGADFFGIVGLDLEPCFGTTHFGRDEPLGRHTYSYSNFMFPIILSLRGCMVPVVTPYIGLGIAMNARFAGEEESKSPNGMGVTLDLSSSTMGFVLLRLGADVKLNDKWRITPEFTLNATGSGDKDHPPQTKEKNYNISVGVYYAP
jgi:hypothetical protein